MNNEIAIAPAQLEELLTLTHEFGTLGDIYTARDIYKASTKRTTGSEDARGAHLFALGDILRIGYIMGQRAERRRTHTHTHRANIWRFCRSHIREGAAA